MDLFGTKKTLTAADIPVDHLDYGYVRTCKDEEELALILQMLEDGVHGKYPDLEEFTKQRMLECMSDEDRKKWIAQNTDPSMSEVVDARQSVNEWLDGIRALDSSITSSKLATSAPPVRGQGPQAEAVEVVQSSGQPIAQSSKADPRTKSFKEYYASWDAFNTDAVRQQ